MTQIISAKTFCLLIQNENVRNQLEQSIMTHISDVHVFTEMPSEAPRVILTDQPNVEPFLNDSRLGSSGIIFLGKLPQQDSFLDDIVSNKLQILDSLSEEDRVGDTLNKALKFSFAFGKADFRIRNLVAGDPLFSTGDRADHVYLLKKGKLRVFVTDPTGAQKDVGTVSPGDFVGEMAYFNNEPRVASVSASENCDLIEIPIQNFEAVLMQKPLWCKKMLQMMSQRIKAMNLNKKQ